MKHLLDKDYHNMLIMNKKRKSRFSKLHLRARAYIDSMFNNKLVPITSTHIRNSLLHDIQLKVSKRLIQRYLREHMDMSYKKIKKISLRHNVKESKLQR